MVRAIFASLLAGSLSACVSLDHPGGGRHAPADMPAHYHFEWQLSGHRAVAPLQVFDDGNKTWLQFPPGQPVPAIFAIAPEGDRLLRPRLQGDYQVLDGVWPRLRVRGGRQQSLLIRLDPLAAAPQAEVRAVVLDDPAPAVQAATEVEPERSAAGDARAAIPLPQSPEPRAGDSPQTLFEVNPGDLTLRAALQRWADSAGWTFLPEHWAVDVDIPLAGSASFPQSFEGAVLELVASTELGDYPLQPCFYSNKVLRVVRHATPCNRVAGGIAP
ncbi:TcpQ domain-containing protein [Paracandidimonas soli]|uniref:Conjugative transfer protein CagX n=3 Tax=Paracandidimonas soli TaxID=1917182 RepID=A0A4R3VCV9_9BURK|nr:TcpQ domain-containing protein [Paracandidimonas soli]TCV01474.1 conjugative transfer protein CagX [Paracandidimonas soli]